jgi:hypothetical protein
MTPLDPLEQKLASSIPVAALNRDAILFEAGRRSARVSIVWPLATLLMAMLATGFGVQLASPPRGERESLSPSMEELPQKRVPLKGTTPPVRQWEQRVLEQGLEGLGPLEPLPPGTNLELGDLL